MTLEQYAAVRLDLEMDILALLQERSATITQLRVWLGAEDYDVRAVMQNLAFAGRVTSRDSKLTADSRWSIVR